MSDREKLIGALAFVNPDYLAWLSGVLGRRIKFGGGFNPNDKPVPRAQQVKVEERVLTSGTVVEVAESISAVVGSPP